jgi:hypothetical protein
MKEIEELDKINTQHRDGLVIETKKTLKSLQILPPGGKKGELSNDELRSMLNGNGRKHFVKLIESVSDVTSIKDYIPRFIIESSCLHLIEHLVKEDRIEDEEISREINSLITDLESRVDETNVIIPLENIKLNDIESIKIGNAMLLNPDKISEIFNNPALIKDKSKGAFPTVHREIQNKVGACIKVKYCSQEIYNAALIKIEPIINLLRIYACFNPNIIYLSPINAPKIKIGISGRTTNANRIMISFKQGKGWGARKEGIIYPELILDREFLEKSMINKFKYINNILCKEYDSLSNFEKQILIAVRWIGLGIDEDIGTDKIIKFAIALECLLLDENDNLKTNLLAKRCAYILGNNSKERQEKEKRAKYFYNLRSRIVHDGYYSVKDEDIYEFQNLVIECLLKLLEIGDKNLAKKIMDTKDLIELINQKEYEALDQYLPNQPWL